MAMKSYSVGYTSSDTPRSFPRHYSLDQPGGVESPDYSHGVPGSDHTNLDARESITIKHYTFSDNSDARNDVLSEERDVSHEPHPGDYDGYAVTTEVKHGDCFTLDTKPGVWRFVGVHVDNPQLMLLAPADHTARAHQKWPYLHYYRSDFSQKFGGINPDRQIERVHPSGAMPSAHATSDDAEPSGIVARITAFFRNL